MQTDSSPPEKSRRDFLAAGAGGAAFLAWLLGEKGSRALRAAGPRAPREDEAPVPPGISLHTIAECEKLAGLSFTEEERLQMLEGLRRQVRKLDGLRSAKLENHEGPAEVFDPRLPGMELPSKGSAPRFREIEPGPLPARDEDIAFAPVSRLSGWIRSGRLASERLTRIYLERLRRFGPRLECVVTITEDLALEQARRADREIREGRIRGPLHGIPWGAKDLFDTRGIPTTWGAAPFRERRPERDATVVGKLEDAGAVLVAKLTLGALAYGDIWFGGRTRNPWRPAEGSSGSSAGSAAATAAGLVGFSLGTETYGSIGSPCARCGATGFRPSFGLVSRAGAMALAWSLDKVGPICRTVEDCAIVLQALAGSDAGDPATVDVPLAIDMTSPVNGVRVGYDPREYEGRAGKADEEMLDILRSLDVELVPVSVPGGPSSDLISLIIDVEAAAAFDELTRSGRDAELRWQEDRAWPNTFRRARLFPAVEYMQARRLRRRLMQEMAALGAKVDAFVAPERHGALHAITNLTGQPALTLRHGFRADGTPRGATLWGRLYGDARLLRLGAALERQRDLWERRPELGEE